MAIQANRRRSRRLPGLPVTGEQKDLLTSAREAGPQAVCFFNNKGGVGKTTLVANLAAELARNFDARILVVDADPQCNLSQYILGDEEAVDIYTSINADINSVYSVIRPLSLGKGYQLEMPVTSSANFGYDVIIGDPRLALQEDLLAQDWRDARNSDYFCLRLLLSLLILWNGQKRRNMTLSFLIWGRR